MGGGSWERDIETDRERERKGRHHVWCGLSRSHTEITHSNQTLPIITNHPITSSLWSVVPAWGRLLPENSSEGWTGRRRRLLVCVSTKNTSNSPQNKRCEKELWKKNCKQPISSEAFFPFNFRRGCVISCRLFTSKMTGCSFKLKIKTELKEKQRLNAGSQPQKQTRGC